jgi:hypothetical protein
MKRGPGLLTAIIARGTQMPASVLTGAAIGLSIAAPFGPVSLICVQKALDHGCRHGLVAGFGAATAHGIVATAAITGAGAASAVLLPWVISIRLLSALILITLGARTVMRARAVVAPAPAGSLHATYIEGPQRAAAQAASLVAAMIRRLCLDEMDLQHSKQILALLQRQPDQPRRIFGHRRTTADLMKANDPIRSDHLQHDPPLHPELPAITIGRSYSTPHFLDGLSAVS